MKSALYFFLFLSTHLYPIESSLDTVITDMEKKHGTFIVILTHEKTGQILYQNHPEKSRKMYSIGSLIKPFTYLASLKSNQINSNEEYICQGFKEYKQDKICWLQPGHGPVNLIQAFAHSCNSYFYQQIVYQKLKRDDFITVLKDFDLDFTFKPYALSDEDFYRSAIGLDGYLLATPESILRAYQFLIHGKFHLASKYNKNKEIFLLSDKYNPEAIESIKEGLRGCYLYGTAAPIYKKLQISHAAAKTGTGMGGIGGENTRKTSGWVILFYPADNPLFSILVLTEKGRGGKEAADITAAIFEKIIKMNLIQNSKN